MDIEAIISIFDDNKNNNMKIIIHNDIVEIQSDKILLKDYQDGLDLIGICMGNDVSGIIIQKSNISEDFFNLKTHFAGEVLQKFSTYDFKLAIVGDFSEYTSKSLTDFIYESNKVGRILFVPSLEDALKTFTLE